MWWGELSFECGASCLLNGASCLLNVGRVVLGRVFFGASCLGASCLWGELSVILRKQHDLYVNNLVGDVKANPRDF